MEIGRVLVCNIFFTVTFCCFFDSGSELNVKLIGLCLFSEEK